MKKKEYLEYRDEPLENVLDFKGLRKAIKDFKEENAIKILKKFYIVNNETKQKKFSPLFPNANGWNTHAGIHNVGIFSTAVCLETIAAYQKNVDECKKTINRKDWVGDCNEEAVHYFGFIIEGLYDDTVCSYGFLAKIATLVRFCNYLNHWNIKDNFIKSISNEVTKYKFYEICLDCILEFHNRLSTQKESTHPFEIYRFLQFVDKWGKEIWNMLYDNNIGIFYITKIMKEDENNSSTNRRASEQNNLASQFYGFFKSLEEFYNTNIKKSNDDNSLTKPPTCEESQPHNFLNSLEEFYNTNIKKANDDNSFTKPPTCEESQPHNFLDEVDDFQKKNNEYKFVFDYFFNEVYLFAKYELYRQMSLEQSGDSKLYDPKRLIYSLLIVYLDNKFSNTLVRNKALELIFSQYRNDKNAIWATGQQVAMSKDGLMIITDNECVCDLLDGDELKPNLLGFIKELKYIYDGYARTKRLDKGEILGWYPIQQRDKTPASWATALTLSFIKRFCKLISLELSRRAKERFRSNYRKPDIKWLDLYDSTAVKAKIRLMFPADQTTEEDRDIIKECKYRTAIMFGPPGTGKTTYGRALATKLGLDYLELTPGDFFAGGEDSILVTINDIFEHLLHLKNTVVFIDEIDDLVKDRNPKPDQSYDRRTLFVNSLLPRFQELHDNKNIILLMATNNIERVDPAILRMGRVDLVIPVGAISPYGRLKYLHEFFEKHADVFGKPEFNDELVRIEMEYLNATEYFNISTLKRYLEMILDEIKKDVTTSKELYNRMTELFNKQAIKKVELLKEQQISKAANNSLLIIKENVIKEELFYDTRPIYSDGDFLDFGYFNIKDYTDTKEKFQKAFIKLYHDLRNDNISADEAKEIKETVVRYCNTFEMINNKIGKKELCSETFYNIMTPFYDDIEKALNETKDKTVKMELTIAEKEIRKLIYNRNMLPA